AFYHGRQIGLLEDLQRRCGGTPLGGDPVAQQGGRIVGLGGQPGGARQGAQGELARLVGGQAHGDAARDQGFQEQEYVGRAAARQGGDGVQRGVILNPYDLANGAQQFFGQLAAGAVHARQGGQAGDTGAHQGGCV